LYIGRLYQKDDKLPLKGAWLCSRDQFLPAEQWTEKEISPRHAVS